MGGLDPYTVLGVGKDASKPEIKRAYKALAKQLHPDVTGDDAAKAEEFKRVVSAYQMLSDPEKRKVYDETVRMPDDLAQERNQLLAAMAQIFNQIVDETLMRGTPLRQSDIIGAMRRRAGSKIGEIDHAMVQVRAQVAELTDLRTRITREDEAENLFAAHLTHRIGGLTQDLVHMGGARRIAELMQTELESYRNEVELVRAMQFTFYGPGGSANATTAVLNWG